ncbi:MAG: ABC transporter permease [Actinomycetota bacterium]
MWALVIKELRQVRRDRRTLAMMIVLPLLLLVMFGYAASFDVSEIQTAVLGESAGDMAPRLGGPFHVTSTQPEGGRAEAVEMLRDGDATVAVVATDASPEVLVDGSKLFEARAAVTALGRVGAPAPEVLFNPGLETSAVMVPALAGLILIFVGTMITSLGVVRERQAGTMEQLAVMPFKPHDVFMGKIAPYFLVAGVDLAIILGVGTWLFDVPFNGSAWILALGALLFLFVTLGLGVLISSVSENQGQAIQLALMTLLPQILLSGMIFPLESMAAGVRWISYLLPLRYFIEIARGVMLRGAPLDSLWEPMAFLAALGFVVFTMAIVRFRRELAPARPRRTGRPRARQAAA